MEKWIREARKAIKDDAAFAYKLCKDTANGLHVRLDWVTETFMEEFRKTAKGAGCETEQTK